MSPILQKLKYKVYELDTFVKQQNDICNNPEVSYMYIAIIKMFGFLFNLSKSQIKL